MQPAVPPAALPFTGDPEADALVAADPLALLVGFVLDQQIPIQRAFAAPLELRRRLGTLDAATIAALDPEAVERAFRTPPALHRFPGAMAARVRGLCAAIVARHDGDAARIWADARDARDLAGRLARLPGIGPAKAATIVALLALRLGVRADGWEAIRPAHPTLANVDSPEALAAYRTAKQAAKAAAKAGHGGA